LRNPTVQFGLLVAIVLNPTHRPTGTDQANQEHCKI
jgi:hypothetical protein